MGERQDWPIQYHFSIVGQSEEGETLAIAWLTALGEETEKVRGLHALMGRDWRMGLIFVQRLLAGGAI
jgi:hypothetical protein